MGKVKPVKFEHKVIDAEPAGWENDVTLIADVNGDGFNDIIIGAKWDPGEGHPEPTANLVWYEYPTWKRHVIGCGNLEAGGVVADIAGNGRTDIAAGEQGRGKNLFWWECPEDPTERWTRRLITDRFKRYHDQAVGDVDGDGRDELVVLSQNARAFVYFDIPEDPHVEPWPEDCCHTVFEDIVIEGVLVVDIDGDGVNEIVAGPNYFKHRGDPHGPWERHELVKDFAWSRAAVADMTGSGSLDLVLSEGESFPGRLVLVEGPDFKNVRVLRDDLCHPHSLAVADFNGDGHPDIFVGEMNLGKKEDPKLFVLLNDGEGNFEETVLECPQGTHEAKVGDIGNTGRISIVGKPYMPHNQVDLWENVTE